MTHEMPGMSLSRRTSSKSLSTDTALSSGSAGNTSGGRSSSGNGSKLPASGSVAETAATAAAKGLQAIVAALRLVIASICTTITGAFTASNNVAEDKKEDSGDPPRYTSVRYGFLQGTFGLPYGGYLVQPPQLRSSITLSESMNMFSVLGTQSEILAFLEDKPTAVFCSMSSRTYTSDISVEVHRSDANSPYSCLWRWWYDSGYRQLVIRARRTFTPRDFNPLVSIHVPQGVLLKEVADLLKSAGCRGSHNMVRDKRLNIKVMDRSRSHMTDSQLRHWFCIGESDVNGDSQSALLPPYRPHADEYQLPPPYTA